MILARQNLHFLDQASGLLESLDDHHFTSQDRHGHSSVGAHLRHVLDAYQCFLRGLQDGRVDYDARTRDPEVETTRHIAQERIGQIHRALSELGDGDRRQAIQVRCDAVAWDDPNAWTRSTIGRELQFLLSHTVHHFALVAMTLRSLDFEPGREFGVAPSTLEHLAGAAAHDESEATACAR